MDDYDKIFSSYVKELTAARAEALAWWQALMAAASPSGDFDQAQQAVRPRWPAGPASHPRIIDVFRRHYLAVERLNDEKRAEVPPPERELDSGWGKPDDDPPSLLSPHAVLRERLDDEEPELASFMEYFVFTPIGIDADGRTA